MNDKNREKKEYLRVEKILKKEERGKGMSKIDEMFVEYVVVNKRQ